jgi:hypothetical protein
MHPRLVDRYVARLIDFRAPATSNHTADSSDVVVLVQWLYKPEELPPRLRHKPWYGPDEVFPANWLDPINPSHIIERVRLFHQNENFENEEEATTWPEALRATSDADVVMENGNGDDESVGEEEVLTLWWRQYYNCQGDVLTPPYKYCTCIKPSKLHELMIHCDKCNTWLHATCIAEEAAKQMKEADGKEWEAEVTSKDEKEGKYQIELLEPDKRRKSGGKITFKEIDCFKCGARID